MSNLEKIEEILDKVVKQNLSWELQIFYYYYKELIENDLSHEYYHLLEYNDDNKNLYVLIQTLSNVNCCYIQNDEFDDDKIDRIYNNIKKELSKYSFGKEAKK